jgi:hypothetical protein
MRAAHAGTKSLIARTKKRVRKFAAVQYVCAVPVPAEQHENAAWAFDLNLMLRQHQKNAASREST